MVENAAVPNTWLRENYGQYNAKGRLSEMEQTELMVTHHKRSVLHEKGETPTWKYLNPLAKFLNKIDILLHSRGKLPP